MSQAEQDLKIRWEINFWKKRFIDLCYGCFDIFLFNLLACIIIVSIVVWVCCDRLVVLVFIVKPIPKDHCPSADLR